MDELLRLMGLKNSDADRDTALILVLVFIILKEKGDIPLILALLYILT